MDIWKPATVSTRAAYRRVRARVEDAGTANHRSVRSYCTEEDEEDEEQSDGGGGEVAHRLEMLSALYISRCLVPAPSYSPYQGLRLALTSTCFQSKAGPKIKEYCQRWQIPALAWRRGEALKKETSQESRGAPGGGTTGGRSSRSHNSLNEFVICSLPGYS